MRPMNDIIIVWILTNERSNEERQTNEDIVRPIEHYSMYCVKIFYYWWPNDWLMCEPVNDQWQYCIIIDQILFRLIVLMNIDIILLLMTEKLLLRNSMILDYYYSIIVYWTNVCVLIVCIGGNDQLTYWMKWQKAIIDQTDYWLQWWYYCVYYWLLWLLVILLLLLMKYYYWRLLLILMCVCVYYWLLSGWRNEDQKDPMQCNVLLLLVLTNYYWDMNEYSVYY